MTDTAPMTEAFVNAREVARALGMSRSWVYQAIRRPDRPMPHHRVGGYAVRFRFSEINEWIAATAHPRREGDA